MKIAITADIHLTNKMEKPRPGVRELQLPIKDNLIDLY